MYRKSVKIAKVEAKFPLYINTLQTIEPYWGLGKNSHYLARHEQWIAFIVYPIVRDATDSECSAYDCEFVALAMKLGTRLVTMDGKVLRSFPSIAVALNAI